MTAITSGLRASRFSVCPASWCHGPPPSFACSAIASNNGSITRFSTSTFSASATPATGATTSSSIGKPIKLLFEHDMPMARKVLRVRFRPARWRPATYASVIDSRDPPR